MAEMLRCELFPDDLDSAVRFYVEILGFHLDRDERSAASAYVALSRGAVRLGLAFRDDAVDAALRRPPTGVELVLEVADLTAAHEHVVATGWLLQEELTERP